MKKILFAGAAASFALALAAAAPAAQAATVDLSGVSSHTLQLQATNAQLGASIVADLGSVNGSDISSSALNANNLNSVQQNIDQSLGGAFLGPIADVSVVRDGVVQASMSNVQGSLSAVVTGAVGNSNVTGSATNLNNGNLVTVNVKQ